MEINPGPPQQPNQPNNPNQPPGTYTLQFKHNPVAARVPESVGPGVFATGSLVQNLNNEYVIDFIQGLARPASIVARVIMTPHAMGQFITALQENLKMFSDKFGPPQAMPKPINPRQPNVEEIYSELKLPDELLSGVYANGVMIGHSPAEFVLDFLTNYYPKSAVSCRVYLSAQQVPRLVDTLMPSLRQIQAKLAQQQQQPPPQPPNRTPLSAACVSVTAVPEVKSPVHCVPAHEMPAGLDVILPEPVSVTVSVIFDVPIAGTLFSFGSVCVVCASGALSTTRAK